MKDSLSALLLVALSVLTSCSSDKQPSNEDETPAQFSEEMSEIGCPGGTIAAGETGNENYEAWCELHTGGGFVPHGPYRSWFPNGTLGTVGQFNRGKRDGLWYGSYESGAKAVETVYVDGEIVSEVYWTKDGQETDLLENSPSD